MVSSQFPPPPNRRKPWGPSWSQNFWQGTINTNAQNVILCVMLTKGWNSHASPTCSPYTSCASTLTTRPCIESSWMTSKCIVFLFLFFPPRPLCICPIIFTREFMLFGDQIRYLEWRQNLLKHNLVLLEYDKSNPLDQVVSWQSHSPKCKC